MALGLDRWQVWGLPLAVRFLALALLLGGLIGGVGNFFLFEDLWVWAMPELAYRFLAAAATAYVFGAVVALARRTQPEQTLLMATVVVYGVPLLAAAIIDRDLIDCDARVSILFLVIVTIALAICGLYLPAGLRAGDRAPRIRQTSRAFVVLLGAAATVVGVIVFVSPKDSGWIWPWAELRAWKELDTRLVASMLLTVGLAALMVAWRPRRGSLDLVLAMNVGYCLVAAAGLAVHAEKTPSFRAEDGSYIAVFGAICLASLVVLFQEHRPEGSRG